MPTLATLRRYGDLAESEALFVVPGRAPLSPKAGVRVSIDWLSLGKAGVRSETPVTVTIVGCPIEHALELVVRQVSNTDRQVTWGLANSGVMVGTRKHRKLMVYEIEEGGSPRTQRIVEELKRAILHTVDPDLWNVNSGEYGSIGQFEGMLFISAPSLMHIKVAAFARHPVQPVSGWAIQVMVSLFSR